MSAVRRLPTPHNRGLRGPRLRALLTVVAIALGPTAMAGPARAQEDSSGVALQLLAQPASYSSDGKLGLRLRVTNDSSESLDGFNINVAVFSRLTSRSGLHASFDAPPGVPGFAQSFQFDAPVPPSGSRVVSLNDRISGLLAPGITEQGVYPATVSVLDRDRVEVLDSFTTTFIYYPTDPDTRLNLVLVVPLNQATARRADGAFNFEAVPEEESLERALGPRGWLGGTLRTLNEAAADGFRFGIAPTPRLVEDITAMAEGYQRVEDGDPVEVGPGQDPAATAAAFLDDLSLLLETAGVQPLLVPYSSPDLPGLQANLPGDVDKQLTEAEIVLSSLGVEPGREWIFPPGGRLDATTLAELQYKGTGAAAKTFFADPSVVDIADPAAAGCPLVSLSFACPVQVRTPNRPAVGYLADEDLQERLTALVRGPEDTRLEIQRLLAETAMIREEAPGIEGRVVQMTLSSKWRPTPHAAGVLYRSLAQASWLRTRTPDRGLQLGIDRPRRQLAENLPPPPGELGEVDYQRIAQAAEVVESFSSMEPPSGNSAIGTLLVRLQRDILTAESRSWYTDPLLAAQAVGHAESAAAEAQREMQKVSLDVNARITLTSRSQDIPMSVSNSTGYPVSATIALESEDLDPPRAELTRVFPPGITPLRIHVTARTSGLFQIQSSLTTPDGLIIQERTPAINSTDFNSIALGITFGALVFLIGFYLLRWLRKRRTPANPRPETA